MTSFMIETPRLILRDWRDEDWEPFFRHTNTPEVMRWLGGVMDEAGMLAQRLRIEAYYREHGLTFWVAERKQDDGELAGEIIGCCGLKKSNQHGAPLGEFEIGWRLREQAWGRGYAREAAEATMAAGFEQFDAPHMIAITVQRNTASWGLMLRLGMEHHPDLDFDSKEFDPESGRMIVYAIERAQWEKNR